MKRLCSVVTLMLLTTAAHAGAMYSFEVGGRTISIDVSGECDSLDCVSVSRRSAHRSNPRHVSADRAAGRTASRNHTRPSVETAEQHPAQIASQQTTRVETPYSPNQAGTSPVRSAEVSSPAPDVVGTLPAAAATDPSSATPGSAAGAPEPTTTSPADAKAGDPAAAKVADAAPSPPHPASAESPDAPVAVSAPKPPSTGTAVSSAGTTPAVPPARAYYAPNPQSLDAKPPALAYYAPAKAPAVAKPAETAPTDHESPTALEGNWLADDKSSTRIKPCGPYLCGYATNSSSGEADQATLIDMKSISSTEWVGMILNRDSGVTYPAIVMLEGDNALRVRSCGMGAAFCGGQVWNRQASVTAVR